MSRWSEQHPFGVSEINVFKSWAEEKLSWLQFFCFFDVRHIWNYVTITSVYILSNSLLSYYIGRPISPISSGQELQQQMFNLMSFLMLEQVDTMLHTESHTF